MNNLNDNFWKWFGNSKVVDEQGNPLEVYHGTDSEFNAFDNTINMSKHRQIGADLGYFFTDNERVARRFIPKRKIEKPKLDIKDTKFRDAQEFNQFKDMFKDAIKTNDWSNIKKVFGEDQFFDLRDDYFTVINKLNEPQDSQEYGLKSCYLKMENPRYADGDIIGTGEDREWFLQNSKHDGYDGVIIKNADTGAGIATEYIVFNPNQIKSVYNNGNWSSRTNNIYEEYKMSIKRLNEEIESVLNEGAVNCSPEVKQLYRELIRDLHPDKSHNDQIGKFLNRAHEENNLKVLKFIKDNKEDLDYVNDVLSGKIKPRKVNDNSSANTDSKDLDLSALDMVNQNHSEIAEPNLDSVLQQAEQDNNLYNIKTGNGKRIFKGNLSSTQLVDELYKYVDSMNAQNNVSYQTFPKFVKSVLHLIPSFKITYARKNR